MNDKPYVKAEFYRSGEKVADVKGAEQAVLYHARIWAQIGSADTFQLATPAGRTRRITGGELLRS